VPKPELFVEPFCGGASVSLGLLEADVVNRVLLADMNPLVAAFWQVTTHDADALVKAMHKESVTVANWDRWRSYRPKTALNKALKCLFLNRTTFSGIIGSNAGPIGGRAQKNYRIDCRFDKDAIEARIRNIQRLHNEGRIIDAFHGSWQSAVRHATGVSASLGLAAEAVMFYLDPPYIEKASNLYEVAFTDHDHQVLAEHLAGTPRWILSYDRKPLALDLYRGMQGVREYRVTHHYTMAGSRKRPVPGREVLFTNLPQAPDPEGEL
jgi:DNA adenine methylase